MRSEAFRLRLPLSTAVLPSAWRRLPVQHYFPKLQPLIEEGTIDPSFVIIDRARLEDGPELYKNSATRKTAASRMS
jgi:threonine dehydrogenase-like Zn-dependent dehydrogenase